MLNPKYLITISYQQSVLSGNQLVWIGTASGSTQSIPAYSTPWYVASMPEVGISATGSTYVLALASLMVIATASTTIDSGTPPLNTIRTW